MQIQLVRSIFLLCLGIISLTGCSKAQPDAAQHNDVNIQTQNTLPVQDNGLLNAPAANTGVPDPNDRTVNVNAPFSNTNVDRDTGSVHVDAPFVHIDKAGRGQPTHIEIGGRSDRRRADDQPDN